MAKLSWKQAFINAVDAYRKAKGTTDKIAVGNFPALLEEAIGSGGGGGGGGSDSGFATCTLTIVDKNWLGPEATIIYIQHDGGAYSETTYVYSNEYTNVLCNSHAIFTSGASNLNNVTVTSEDGSSYCTPAWGSFDVFIGTSNTTVTIT